MPILREAEDDTSTRVARLDQPTDKACNALP